ncbi:AAA family ATPase [Roseivivax sp. CAU 1753]
MSIAQKDIELQTAQAIMTEPELAQILIIARSQALLDTLSREMASDANVQGHTVCAEFPEVVRSDGQNWDLLNFVVFELGCDMDADLEAVRRLHGRTGGTLPCIAVSPTPVADPLKAEYLAAGVAEVLVLSAPASGIGAEAPASDSAPASVPDSGPVSGPEPVAAKAEAPSEPAAITAEPAEPHCAPDPDAATAPQSADVVEDVAEDAPAAGGDVTVVLRARGGAGATTVAVNLAMDLASGAAAGSVALVDLDLQNGSVGLALDLAESTEATALIRAGSLPTGAFLDRAMVRHSSGVDVLTAPDVFAPLSAMTPAMVSHLIAALKARYDHIVLDLPQAVLDWTSPILAEASRALIVSDMSVPSVKRVRRLIDLISEEHMTLPIRTVINFEKRPLFPSQVHKEAAHLIGRTLDHWIPNEPRAARRAVDMGVPMRVGAKRSGAAKAISALRKSLFTEVKKG